MTPLRFVSFHPFLALCTAVLALALPSTGVNAAAAKPAAQSQAARTPQRLPLDPLTAEDRRLVEEVARGNERFRTMVGGAQLRTISVDLLPWKPDHEEKAAPTGPEGMQRYAAVLYRLGDTETGIRVIVNLTTRTVVETTPVTSMELPLTPDDIGEASRLALENAQLREALGNDLAGYAAAAKTPGARADRYAITGLRLFSSGEDDPCKKHRCVRLMFRRDRDYLGQPLVWVDLTERAVHVERREQ